MKKPHVSLHIVTLLSLLIMFMSTPVLAQSEYDEGMQRANIPQSSGLVDENGNPISVEDFESTRTESQKNVFQRHPALIIAVGGVIGGVVGFVIKKKLNK